MKHPKWEDIYEYATGEAIASGLSEHLKDCTLCKSEYERAKRLLEVLEQTEELRPEQPSRIAYKAWYAEKQKPAIGLDVKLKWALAPLALVLAVAVTVWLIVTGSYIKRLSVLEKPWGFLGQGQVAAKELGLDKFKLDFSALEQSERDLDLKDLGVELPDESYLPEVTSSYVSEVFELEDTDQLLKELGVKAVDGQTSYGRMS